MNVPLTEISSPSSIAKVLTVSEVNAGGVFVWLAEDATSLQKIGVEPGVLPYDRVERLRADLNLSRPRPLTYLWRRHARLPCIQS